MRNFIRIHRNFLHTSYRYSSKHVASWIVRNFRNSLLKHLPFLHEYHLIADRASNINNFTDSHFWDSSLIPHQWGACTVKTSWVLSKNACNLWAIPQNSTPWLVERRINRIRDQQTCREEDWITTKLTLFVVDRQALQCRALPALPVRKEGTRVRSIRYFM